MGWFQMSCIPTLTPATPYYKRFLFYWLVKEKDPSESNTKTAETKCVTAQNTKSSQFFLFLFGGYWSSSRWRQRHDLRAPLLGRAQDLGVRVLDLARELQQADNDNLVRQVGQPVAVDTDPLERRRCLAHVA